MDLIILDDVWPVVRFFRERKHAEQLAQGFVWLSTLGSCRGYEEDGRGDADEATQVYRSGEVSGAGADRHVQHVAYHSGIKIEISPGTKINHVSIIDATYLRGSKDAFALCASQKFDPSCMETFGPYCAEISRPRSFLWLVTKRLGFATIPWRSHYGKDSIPRQIVFWSADSAGSVGICKACSIRKPIRIEDALEDSRQGSNAGAGNCCMPGDSSLVQDGFLGAATIGAQERFPVLSPR